MDITEAQPTTPTETPIGLPCPTCGKTFNNEQGLRMHKLRKHSGKGWDTSRNFGNVAESKRLAKRREYQAKLRERYKVEGKDSRGYPKKNWGTTGMKLGAWSKERRAKFNSTWRSKNARKKIAPIVYPLPKEEMEVSQVVIPTLKHCPECGAHLVAWRYSP